MILDHQLRALATSGLIQLVATQPDPEYLFRHALIQDAAYNSLLRQDRRHIHRRVAETVERLNPQRLDQLAAILAYHFGLADDHNQAFAYFRRAGDRARAIFANAEAVTFYRAAIAQASHLPHLDTSLAQLHEQLGDVLDLTGKLEEARAAYHDALSHAPESNGVVRARLHRKIGSVCALQFRYQDAADALDQAEYSLGSAPTEPVVVWWQEWIQIQLDRMRSLYWQGQWQAVAHLVEKTEPILEQYGTPALRFHFYDGRISVAERRDRYVISDEVLTLARAMLAAAQESGDQRLIAMGHFQLGFCLLWHDDFDEAETELRVGEDMMRRIGDAIWLTHALTYIGILYRRRGQIDAARPYFSQTFAAAKANQMAVSIARAEANLAWLALREAKMDEAYQQGLAALESWSHSSFADPFRWTGYLPLLVVALHKDEMDEAVRYARAMLEPTQYRLPDPIDVPLTKAVQVFEHRQLDSVRSYLQEAIASAEQLCYL